MNFTIIELISLFKRRKVLIEEVLAAVAAARCEPEQEPPSTATLLAQVLWIVQDPDLRRTVGIVFDDQFNKSGAS